MRIAIITFGAAVFFSCVCAMEAVKNIWISNNNWVNGRTDEDFARDAIRLWGVQNGTNEEKAIAIYRSLHRVLGHGGTTINEGIKGSELHNHDTRQLLHNNPEMQCVNYNQRLMHFWMAHTGDWTKNSVKKIETRSAEGQGIHCDGSYDFGHTQAGLVYEDTDGITRCHLFDAHRGMYTYSSDSTHVATPEECAANVDLIVNPPVKVEPYFLRVHYPLDYPNRHYYEYGLWWESLPECNPPFLVDTANTPPAYLFKYKNEFPSTDCNVQFDAFTTNFYLRKGESLRRCWYDTNKAAFSQEQSAYSPGNLYCDDTEYRYNRAPFAPKDTWNLKAILPYMQTKLPIKVKNRFFGNAFHEFTPPLANDSFSMGAKSADGLSSNDTLLHPSVKSVPGQVIYEIYSIYRIAESFIEADYYLKSPGSIAVDFSTDSGTTWNSAWSTNTVSSGRQHITIDIGKSRWDMNLPATFNMASSRCEISEGRFSPFYGYKYLVRIKMQSDNDVNNVGMVSLTFKNIYMLNMFMLPTLLPGQNIITVEGDDLPSGCAVKVDYVWMENGVQKTHTAACDTLPYAYSINVEEPDTTKIKCVYHTVSVVDTSEVELSAIRTILKLSSKKQALLVYPCPAVLGNSIIFQVADKSGGSLMIYNSGGRLINILPVDGLRIFWDGKDNKGKGISSGQYFVRCRGAAGEFSREFSVVK
ncbi:MAG: hypothetical protein ABIA63_08660 [bacterium]